MDILIFSNEEKHLSKNDTELQTCKHIDAHTDTFNLKRKLCMSNYHGGITARNDSIV